MHMHGMYIKWHTCTYTCIICDAPQCWNVFVLLSACMIPFSPFAPSIGSLVHGAAGRGFLLQDKADLLPAKACSQQLQILLQMLGVDSWQAWLCQDKVFTAFKAVYCA